MYTPNILQYPAAGAFFKRAPQWLLSVCKTTLYPEVSKQKSHHMKKNVILILYANIHKIYCNIQALELFFKTLLLAVFSMHN